MAVDRSTARYLNTLGVIASAPGFAETHASVTTAMRRDPHALQRLLPWGLETEPSPDPDVVR